MSWPFIVLIIALVLILAITYLFKVGVLGKAKARIGASAFTFELDMQSKQRQITEDDFRKIDLNKFYVDSGIGFVIQKPLPPDWVVVRGNIRNLWDEKGFSEQGIQFLPYTSLVTDPTNNTSLTCFRRGPKQSIKYTADSTIDDRPIDLKAIDQIKELYIGSEELLYDQIAIITLRKDAFKTKTGLLELFLSEMAIAASIGPKRLAVNPENTVFLIDCSAIFKNIEYNGQRGDHVINNTVLLQENSDYFFVAILTYAQASDKPTKVWDDLTRYLSSFRVSVK